VNSWGLRYEEKEKEELTGLALQHADKGKKIGTGLERHSSDSSSKEIKVDKENQVVYKRRYALEPTEVEKYPFFFFF